MTSRTETNPLCVNKGGKFCGEPLLTPTATNTTNSAEGSEGCPVLKDRTQADAAIVEQGEKPGESQSDDHVRQINGPARDAVEFHRIEPGKNVASNLPHGHRFPRTDDEVGQHHHPSGGKADRSRKNFRGVGDLAGGVGHGRRPAGRKRSRSEAAACRR